MKINKNIPQITYKYEKYHDEMIKNVLKLKNSKKMQHKNHICELVDNNSNRVLEKLYPVNYDKKTCKMQYYLNSTYHLPNIHLLLDLPSGQYETYFLSLTLFTYR